MVRLIVREVAERQGVKDATDLARRTGLAYGTAYRLWQGDVGGESNRSVGILTLHRVAKALGVTMGDLYVEEDRRALRPAAA